VPPVQDADDDLGVAGSGGRVGWSDLLLAHRKRWLDTVLGERDVIDLDREANPAEAIAQAAPDAAVIWTEGFHGASGAELRQQLCSAAARGTAVVLGVPLGDASEREAEALRQELGNATLIVQQLAAASLMGEDEASDSAVHLLVCANLEASIANGAGTEPDVTAAPLVSGYVAHLERANKALRDANVRLAREHLGVHDSAAAAVEERRMKLAERVGQLEAALETEKQVALRNHELFLMARDVLKAPRYRAVDKVRDLLFSVPGARALLDSRSRRLAASGEWMESARGPEDARTPR
jgi:hypothetical protein